MEAVCKQKIKHGICHPERSTGLPGRSRGISLFLFKALFYKILTRLGAED